MAGALVLATVGASAAMADTGSGSSSPSGDPTTSQDAKKAWDDSSHQAEVAAEQLNGARVAQAAATQAAARAASDVLIAERAVTVAQQRAVAAAAVVTGYQSQLDSFANASLRGAHLSEMTALLTARNADEFLDQATSIEEVAQDTRAMLTEAVTAKTDAAAAQTAAATAEATAEHAKITDDTAAATAIAATRAAQGRKADLDAAVAKYKTLYGKLSAAERAAAAAAAEKARADSLARAQAAERLLIAQAASSAASASSASSSSSAESAESASRASLSSASATSSSSSTSVSSASTSSAAPSTTSPAAVIAQSSTTSSPASTSSSPPSNDGAASSSISGGDKLGQIAAAAAMTKIGGGYCYACDGPSSFDCSGLTTWAWAQAGISIPRVSYEQANFPEVPLDELQPGDLVTYYSPVSHVAIYVGNGMVVSAADEELGIIYVPVHRAGPDATGHRVPRG